MELDEEGRLVAKKVGVKQKKFKKSPKVDSNGVHEDSLNK